MSAVETLEDRIGYHFKDPQLLTTALTHSSCINEHPETNVSGSMRVFVL